jgi:hypothetical protein
MPSKIKLLQDGLIYVGPINKSGLFSANKSSEVTADAIDVVFRHIVNMKTTTDSEETLEFDEPIFKHGRKPYKVQIILTPL